MVKSRSALSLVELMMALVLLGAVLGPAIGTMRRQITDTQWSNERLMAIQLANEVLEYHKTLGYDGIRLALTNQVPPVNVAPVVDGAFPGYKVYDSWVGDAPAHLFPPGKAALPNGINPCLGGPGDVHSNTFNTPPDFVSPMPAGKIGSEAEVTLRQAFRFSRRVEIFGGDATAQLAPPRHFQPFPGMTQRIDCYFIRVTIKNERSMVTPASQYQAVTIIARH